MTIAEAHFVPSSGGVQVAVHHLGGSHGRPVVVVAHATGFHGRCYLPIAAELGDRWHTIGFDFRGHGDTAAVGEPVGWEPFGDDAHAVARSAPAPMVGFGHSMGGAALLMAAHRDPGLFSCLVLFEPIVFPPPSADPPPNPLIEAARRRRPAFPSFEAAIENYASKPPLSVFTPESLEAYVHHGFRASGEGLTLKCDPHYEAATFANSAHHATWFALGAIDVPVLVLSGRAETGRPANIAGTIADRLPRGSYRELSHLDHFGPMSHPHAIAEAIVGFATRHEAR